MTYVEDFLELNANLPRDTIRLSKLMREVDEKSFNSQKAIAELRKKYIYLCKSKNRNEKHEQELLKQIENEYNIVLNFSDHKLELVSEQDYIANYHLKKLIEIIENYEKSVQSSALQQGLIPISFSDFKIGDKAMSVIADDMSIAGSKKRDNYSTKSARESGMASHSTQFLKKKKQRPLSKGSKKEKEEAEEFTQNLVETNYIDFDKQENELIYCICNGPSYGDMIKCDNDSCEKEWFHYGCVNINAIPKGKWFCSPDCQQKAKKRKR